MTKMQIVLTYDDFDFLIATLQYASLEIAEKKEAKQEERYDRIETKLWGVQQPYSLVMQSPLHRENHNWEMSHLNSTA